MPPLLQTKPSQQDTNMSHIVPAFIFVPNDGVETECCFSQEELSQKFYCVSRWTEGNPSVIPSPPKLPSRRQESHHTSVVRFSAINVSSSPCCKTDCCPKLPRRSSFLTTTVTADHTSRRQHRRARSVPLSQPRLLLLEQLQHQRQVFQRSIPIASIPIASRIVERAHQKTRQLGPRRFTVAARTA